MLESNGVPVMARRHSAAGANFWFQNPNAHRDESGVDLIRVGVPHPRMKAEVQSLFMKQSALDVIDGMDADPAAFLGSLGLAAGISVALLGEEGDGTYTLRTEHTVLEPVASEEVPIESESDQTEPPSGSSGEGGEGDEGRETGENPVGDGDSSRE